MVNLFRRFQKPLMVIVTALTILSFTWFYSRSDYLDQGAGNHVGTVYGHNFSQAQFMHEARKYELCQYLLFDLWQSLIQPAMSQDDAVNNFVWNSVVLRHEADRLGIRPTDSEVEAAIKALPAFQTNGHYDSFKYNQFVQNALGPRGLMPDALEDMVGDEVRLRRVKAVLGATVAPAPAEVRSIFEQRHAKMECSVIRFDFAEFLKAQAPSDEDVKKAYEERKSTLKTDELRKVKVVAFTIPNTEKPLVGKERVDAFEKLSEKAQGFMVATTDKNAKFEDIASKLGAKVQETKLFSRNDPPAELDKSSQAAAAAFKLTRAEPTSDAVQTDKGYLLLQLVDVVPAREKTFEEAKTALADTLKEERAQEAMNLKATEVRNKIEAEMKAGKSFADAAATAGVKPEQLKPFSLVEPPLDQKDGREITLATRDLQVGQISQFIPTSAGAGQAGGLLVHLAKKMPVEEKQFEEGKAQLAEEIGRMSEEGIFREWLKSRRAAANIATAHGPQT